MTELNPFRTIRKKGGKWDEYISWYDNYNGQCTDSVIFLVDSYGMAEGEFNKLSKFLDAVTDYDGTKFSWDFRDSVIVDYEDNCAYTLDYGEIDTLGFDGEVVGRRRIENGEVTWDDISEHCINVSDKALPSWFPDLEGFEERSCDFQNGWSGSRDDPAEITKQFHQLGYDEVVFQISSVNPFAVNFCVHVKPRKDKE